MEDHGPAGLRGRVTPMERAFARPDRHGVCPPLVAGRSEGLLSCSFSYLLLVAVVSGPQQILCAQVRAVGPHGPARVL